MLKIRKIKCSKLNEFYKKEKYSLIHPISLKRILSYQNNPKRNDQLAVLYLGYIDNELITYRTVLQGEFHSNIGKSISCIWLSGSWTHPDHRKKDIYSNYGNDSFSLFSKRADLLNYQFSLAEILPPKSRFFAKIVPENHRLNQQFYI